MTNWISVKEKEIPKCKDILFCNQYQIGMGSINYDGKPWIFHSQSPWESEITHWAELPKLPEQNEEIKEIRI